MHNMRKLKKQLIKEGHPRDIVVAHIKMNRFMIAAIKKSKKSGELPF